MLLFIYDRVPIFDGEGRDQRFSSFFQGNFERVNHPIMSMSGRIETYTADDGQFE